MLGFEIVENAEGLAMEVLDIAIVGGGLGGLALALALQERGIGAHVFDKAPKVRKHSGTSISISLNGTLFKISSENWS